MIRYGGSAGWVQSFAHEPFRPAVYGVNYGVDMVTFLRADVNHHVSASHDAAHSVCSAAGCPAGQAAIGQRNTARSTFGSALVRVGGRAHR